MSDTNTAPLATEVDPKVLEGMQLALDNIIAFGSKLGSSILAYPGNRDGVRHAAYRLFSEIQFLKGIDPESADGEAAHREYMLAWRG